MLQSRGEIDAAGKKWENENALEWERVFVRSKGDALLWADAAAAVGHVPLITSLLLRKMESGSSAESPDQEGKVEGLRGGKRGWNSLEDWEGEQAKEM